MDVLTLKQYHRALRNPPKPKPPKVRDFAAAKYRKEIEQWRAAGKSCQWIANKINLTHGQVDRFVRRKLNEQS